MNLRNSERDIITHPHAWTVWLAGPGMMALGVVWLLIFGAKGWTRDGIITGVLGALMFFIGISITIFRLIPHWLRQPFHHARADALPHVPSLPVDTYTGSFIKPVGSRTLLHRLAEHGRNISLEPDRRAHRKMLAGVPGALVLLLSAFGGILFFTPLADPMIEDLNVANATVGRWTIFLIFGSLLIVLGILAVTIIMLVQKQSRYSVAFDLHNGQWRIDRKNPPEIGEIERLIAVQLCIHSQMNSKQNFRYTYQLILVEELAEQETRRHMLLEAQRPANQIGHIGNQLANRLDLPLLHHAKKSHRIASEAEGKRRWEVCR